MTKNLCGVNVVIDVDNETGMTKEKTKLKLKVEENKVFLVEKLRC